ncbi:hypothetical protein [Alkalimonas sp.]|uniref:hypothetical protein n=1 Tax=Alkalimonas sp. TaxID=1872453 RepID=UPI00263B64E1|nr:hypothetical protein [Alkalimonas sp.]MCC5827395.1 hypothetical protein [Alkalimonas sp.]
MNALIYEQFNPLIVAYSGFLTQRGYQVFATKDIDEAWQGYLRDKPTLVVAKYEATTAHPAASGMELVKKIRDEANDWRTPCLVIGCTVHRADEIAFAALKPLAILRLSFEQSVLDTRLSDLGLPV